MPKPKVTPELATFVAEKNKAGLSLREIVSWLKAAHALEVTPQTIKNVLDKQRDVARRRAEGPPAAPRASPVAKAPLPPVEPPAAASDAVEVGPDDVPVAAPVDPGDDPDIATLDRVLVELDGDIAQAREGGAQQALATLQRLYLDALERRRKLRPPAPPPEADAEALAIGARAIDRMRKLVALEREKLDARQLELGGPR